MTTRITLLDFLKQKDPDGTLAESVNLMEQYNPPLQDAPAVASNAPLGNRVTYTRSLPAVGTAKINKGVVRSKGQTDQRTDPIGFFAGLSEIDARIKSVEGVANYAAKRRDEDKLFEEAFAQLICNNIFYGDTKLDEAAFDGLAPRMATLNQGTSKTASQVWSNGTVTGSDGCSIFIVDWGDMGAKLIHPPAANAGLSIEDKGEVRVTDDAGNPFFAGTTSYDWMIGLSIKDPRRIARLANIDLSDALAGGSTQGVMVDKLERIMAEMPSKAGHSRVLYCPTSLWAAFTKQARGFSNLALRIDDYLGEPHPHFWECPLRKVDQLAVNEGTVS